MNLRRPDGRPHVIGHRGAAAVAPENTLGARGVGAHVDLKLVGAEDRVAAAVKRHGFEQEEPREVSRLAVIGVDSILSDDPGMAVRVLATLETP